jgi:hypothetical protein
MNLWNKLPRDIKRIIIGFDEFFNVITLGRPEETISSRVGRASLEGNWWAKNIFEPVIDFLLGKDHCKNNIEILSKNHE